MNCQQIQDLLPLYIGSELEENRARLVAAHMQNCETCSGTAREYREARQLLQTFVPPAFTENFYAEMRRSVWQDIEKKPAGPAVFSIVADLFRPRLAWAVVTAVLIAVSVMGIYVISRRAGAPQPVVSDQPPANTTPNEQHPTSSPNNKSSASSLASSGTDVPQPYRQHKRKTISDRPNVAALPTVATVSSATTSAPANREVSDASRAPLRVEIQTKNPNIRIIWFAPRDTKQVSPNSKGI